MDSLKQIETLLHEVAEHLKSPSKADRRVAAQKLERIVAIASTLAFTLQAAH